MTGDKVWKLQRSTLVMFSDLEDECFTNDDIVVQNCLRVENPDLVWIKYERDPDPILSWE